MDYCTLTADLPTANEYVHVDSWRDAVGLRPDAYYLWGERTQDCAEAVEYFAQRGATPWVPVELACEAGVDLSGCMWCGRDFDPEVPRTCAARVG